MLSIALASFVIGLQSQAAIAEYPEQPKTWTIEYPFVIDASVAGYYNCLQSEEVIAGEGYTFEGQHRKAVESCEKKGKQAQKDANAILAKSGRYPAMTPEKVTLVFETLRKIHIERGRDIDVQIAQDLAGNPYADQIQTSASQNDPSVGEDEGL